MTVALQSDMADDTGGVLVITRSVGAPAENSLRETGWILCWSFERGQRRKGDARNRRPLSNHLMFETGDIIGFEVIDERRFLRL